VQSIIQASLRALDHTLAIKEAGRWLLGVWLTGHRISLIPRSFFVSFAQCAVVCIQQIEDNPTSRNIWANNRLVVMCWLVDQDLLERTQIPCSQERLLEVGMDYLAGARWDPSQAKYRPRNPFFYQVCNALCSFSSVEAAVRPAHAILTTVVLSMTSKSVGNACQSLMRYYDSHGGQGEYKCEDLRLLTLVYGYVELSKCLDANICNICDRTAIVHCATLLSSHWLMTTRKPLVAEQVRLLVEWYVAELYGILDFLRNDEFYALINSPELRPERNQLLQTQDGARDTRLGSVDENWCARVVN
jgi:hypothetical protein